MNAQQDERTAQAFRVTGRTGVRLQCFRWGTSSRIVAAVHGMNAHGLHWRKLAERLVPRYSLVSYDMRGHGDSDKPDSGYGFEDQSYDLDAVVEQVTSEAPVVIGHSLGARVAMLYAARKPTRGLIMVDPGITPLDQVAPPRNPNAARRPGLRFEYDSEDEFMERMRRTNFLRNWSPYAEEYARYGIEPNEAGGVRLKFRPQVQQESGQGFRSFDAVAVAAKISCPTLVMRATEGHMRPEVAERLVQTLPNARLAVIEGANHNVMLDKPEVFEALVEDFLAEVYRE